MNDFLHVSVQILEIHRVDCLECIQSQVTLLFLRAVTGNAMSIQRARRLLLKGDRVDLRTGNAILRKRNLSKEERVTSQQ